MLQSLDPDTLHEATRLELWVAARRLGVPNAARLGRQALVAGIRSALAAGAPPAAERLPSPTPTLPLGYGRDRITALAVDPDRLYCCWEVTDEGMARAAMRLRGTDAALAVRVYDTTGRLFDGTNAHRWFDLRVARADRQWFFDLGRPGSEAFAEVGMLAETGFARIARSRRVEFPRREPAPLEATHVSVAGAPAVRPEAPSRPPPRPDLGASENLARGAR